ncbi:MAG: hypothetical protein JW757_12010 [Anaerolineales bacterium]|nr:hypothetical protein [Anaerolineales bacterium]
MTDKPKKNRLAKLNQDNPGLFTSMSRTLQLVFRLVLDGRVSFWLKLLPIGALAYLFSPLDAAIPAVDDALIIGLGTYTFLELCPQDIVEEHQARIVGRQPVTPDEEDIVDVPYTRIDED